MKEMTASELLRDCARRSTRPELAAAEYYFPETYVDDYTCDLCGLFRAIADKIDAELAQVRADELRDLASIWAKVNGWPDFREGEDFGAWLDRCALPRPRFEDGEPVQMGDEIAIGGGSIDVNEAVMLLDGSGYRLLHSKDVSASAIEDRVKRPAPEVLGADGKPIAKDEMVYPTYGSHIGDPCKVLAVLSQDNVRVSVPEGGNERFDGCYLTHTPPDTQERIDEDKHKVASAYWRCESEFCSNCPSKIDGMSPMEYYGVCICDVAQGMDIARRQRELDARKGGAE